MTLTTPSVGSASTTLRVAISSTAEELGPYRVTAREVACDLGFEILQIEHPGADGRGVQEHAGRVADADLLVAIIGWRRGEVPDPGPGGDGIRSWTAWVVRAALRRALPVVVMMAGDGWPKSLREEDPEARAWLLDFRGDLHSLATFFEPEPAALTGFRELVRRELTRHGSGTKNGMPPLTDGVAGEHEKGLRLRSWPIPDLPEQPYPLLLPYTDPRLLAGRELECQEVERRLRLPVPILGLYAASGAGKSSLLLGALVPALRAAGRPVAVVRHPAEPGLAGKLISDLLEADDVNALDLDDEDSRGFVARLLAARTLAGAPPVLVVDQFEDLLNQRTGLADGRQARAVAGLLLAASSQRHPGCDGPLCRWVLAYRQEFHGEVIRWLGDALREARGLGLAGAGTLPHDLSGAERFHAWSLQPLAVPPAESTDPVGEAARVFRMAIEKPLAVHDDGGAPRYPWTFAAGGAERLARAFGEARVAQPQAPLVPELQVVLAHLLELAGEPFGDQSAVVEVPEEPGELIDQALELHLRRALDAVFPATSPSRRRSDARAANIRIVRTRALLALRELADVDGLPVESLARAIGPRSGPAEGREVLERLATPEKRLVVLVQQAGAWCYVLSHDRMAEILVRLVDGEEGYATFGVDAELLGLRRFVKLKSELFVAGEVDQATEVPAGHLKSIEKHAAALLWGKDSEDWWQACHARARAERRRTMLQRAGAAFAVAAMVLGVWLWTDRRARRAALLEEVAAGEPEVAFVAADRLLVKWHAEPEEVRAALRQREKPLELLERGIGGVAVEDGREDAVLRLAELALPLIVDDAPEDPVRIASLVWALDFFAPEGERTQSLRDRALEPLRRGRPPPRLPGEGVPPEGDKWGNTGWADIPAGTFWMGSGPGEGRDEEDKLDERPKHRVTLSAFRMGTHEVTNAEFRQLYPEHAEDRDDRLPAASMNWYQAYTYAAWLGGRLPTEAEAEYTRRAACDFAYCRSDGSEASLDEVAWWRGNATDPETGDPTPRPVGQLEPNRWGLFDVYGNVTEFCADWDGTYSAEDQADPSGPTSSDTDYRRARGGSVFDPPWWVAAPGRDAMRPGDWGRHQGLRVVLVNTD